MVIIKEFKEFAMRGNVVDLAVAFILGAGFNKIVSSLVEDLIMPPLGWLIGGMDFKDYKLTLKEGSEGVAPVTLNYGEFIQTVFDFIIIAFAVFLLVKALNSFRRKQAAAPEQGPETLTKDQQLLIEIRDALTRTR
jgi:large conductance mechanosensitive channel